MIGSLFVDYVRMLRSMKSTDWSQVFSPEDMAYLREKVDPTKWYPMSTFERFGNAILKELGNGDLELVRMWGRTQVDQMQALYPDLVAAGDPFETLMRFRVLRATFFDFDALDVAMVVEGEANMEISYHMGNTAEEAASYQTLGFFERLLELAGATTVKAQFLERKWAGDPRTMLSLEWR